MDIKPLKRLFIDMDGVLAKWQVATYEELLQKDYFLYLPENETFCDGIRVLCNKFAQSPKLNCEIYILSAVLADSEHAIADKNEWLDEHFPCIPHDHRIFVSDSDKATAAVKFTNSVTLTDNDFLLDDYTQNLVAWENAGGHAIKVFNGVNGNTNPWDGDYVCTAVTPFRIFKNINMLVNYPT